MAKITFIILVFFILFGCASKKYVKFCSEKCNMDLMFDKKNNECINCFSIKQ